MLLKKLFRTLWQYKAQFISMVIMVALGVGVFLGFNVEWYSLEVNTREIYDATGFADFRIYNDKGFTEKDLETVKAIPGVEDATRFLSLNVAVKDDTDTLALTVSENMNVSGILLMAGEPYDAASPDGFWLSDSYAAANGISLGDQMTLTYQSITVQGTVRGLVKSSEYLICLPDTTQMMPDYSSYGYVYISPAMLEHAVPSLYKMMIGSMYHQINVKSALDKAAFVEQADRALGSTRLILSKDETVSWSEAMGEVNEGKTMASILPVLFLAIAILTMVTTMHRITASEKTQIGTFKALGFKDRRILIHYSAYALIIGLMGTLLGVGIGYWLGWFIMNPDGAMATYIDMPSWALHAPRFTWFVLIGINAFLTLIGFLSVRKMLSGTAADALRPYTPKRMKHLRFEETKRFKALGFGTKWNLRDCVRHKARSLMTLFGIVGCMVLLVGGLGMQDTMNAFLDVFYEKAINYTTRVNLDGDSMTLEEGKALAEQLGGDWAASRAIQIGDKGYSLEIYSVTRDKVCFADTDMRIVPLTDEGAYICARIARDHHLKIGDTLHFSPYDSDEHYAVPVAGVLDSMTEGVFMTAAFADQTGIAYTVSSVFTDETDIPEDGRILNKQSKQSIMDSFDTFMDLMNKMIWLLVLAAVILGIVVLYNLGVMSYTERYREMATLKVVGFKDGKIGRLLISQNLWLTVIGILIGVPMGVGVLQYLLTALASEYELKLVLGPATWFISVFLTFGVSLLVGLMVARKNRYIDMVAALKTEE
ncbi:MAG: ABC transporter permease [Clostridiales bacterium]|nr:ABC transporter permease [Clostridiales bacterium]